MQCGIHFIWEISESADLQSLHTKFVGMLMTYLHTKFRIPSSDDSHHHKTER